MAHNSFYSLNLNDFSRNIRTVWEQLRQKGDFCDVTLACEGQQIGAHKVILSGFSPVFKDLLKENNHPHPLLYLRGVKYSELVNILDFIYQGEISIEQEQLNNFVHICKEFQIKGLAQESGNIHHNLKRSRGDDPSYLKTKKIGKYSNTQDNGDQPTFIKSEPNTKESENKIFGENEEDHAIGSFDMDYVCDDNDYFEEEPAEEPKQIKKKENYNKKQEEIMVGPKPFYEIIKNPMSSKSNCDSPGILILNKKFIFHFNQRSKNRHNSYYNCSFVKSTGCKAKATMTDSIFDDKGDGHIEEESIHGYVLSKWTHDDVHNHDGNPGRVFAEKMMIEMINKISADPSLSITKLYNGTLEKCKEELGDDALWTDVMEALGKKTSSLKRLWNSKAKALENNAKK